MVSFSTTQSNICDNSCTDSSPSWRFFSSYWLFPSWEEGVRNAGAQSFRVAVADHEVIIPLLPEYEGVQQQLQSEVAGKQEEFQALYEEYQDKVDRYQKQQALLSDERRQEREQELLQLQQLLQTEEAQTQQDLAIRQLELMEPLYEKVQIAINEVADVQGVDVVLRRSIGGEPLLLYVDTDTVEDITLDVARNLGLDIGEGIRKRVERNRGPPPVPISMQGSLEAKRITTQTLQDMKREGVPIAMLTAYDYTSARILDAAGVDVLLVGDSASNTVAGYETTLPITLDQMIYHAQSVIRGVRRALVVVDLPFGSYQGNSREALVSRGSGDEGGGGPRREDGGRQGW